MRLRQIAMDLDKTYQEDDRHVQQERNECVGQECEDANAVDVAHGHARNLNEHGDHAIDNSAGRRIVIQRDERVHLELGGAQHALDHDETEGLEDDTATLV